MWLMLFLASINVGILLYGVFLYFCNLFDEIRVVIHMRNLKKDWPELYEGK